MVTAAADFKNTVGADIKINQTYFLRDMPSDYDVSIKAGTVVYLRFGGVGKPYNDSDIRLLLEDDCEQIAALATPNDDH